MAVPLEMIYIHGGFSYHIELLVYWRVAVNFQLSSVTLW